MNFSDREQTYIEFMVSRKTNNDDILQQFSQEELEAFEADENIKEEIKRRKAEIVERENEIERKKIAQKILELEHLEKIIPLAYRAMEQILVDPKNKNIGLIIKIILSGKIKYLEKFAEIMAERDLGHISGNLDDRIKNLAYSLDDE